MFSVELLKALLVAEPLLAIHLHDGLKGAEPGCAIPWRLNFVAVEIGISAVQ